LFEVFEAVEGFSGERSKQYKYSLVREVSSARIQWSEWEAVQVFIGERGKQYKYSLVREVSSTEIHW
jgi:hypothetical protein